MVGTGFDLPSQRYVENVLAAIPWLKTSTQYYGAYFSCGICTTWEKNIEALHSELRGLIIVAILTAVVLVLESVH